MFEMVHFFVFLLQLNADKAVDTFFLISFLLMGCGAFCLLLLRVPPFRARTVSLSIRCGLRPCVS